MKKNDLPSFLGIGTAKAGTTTLHDLLSFHPEICLPYEQKEVGFFYSQDCFAKGVEWYKNCFKPSKQHKILGEITPQYLSSEAAPGRIRDTLGTDIRFIVVLRNPVARAFSHYLHMRQRGAETRSFEKAVQDEESKDFTFADEDEKNSYGYITYGQYARHLERWFKIFPRENFLILTFEEDILKNQEAMWQKVLEHLNVSDRPLPQMTHSNKTYEPRSVWLNALILKLWPIFKPVVKPFLPSQEKRQKLWQLIMATNKKPRIRLADETRAAYFERLFADDVTKLEALVQKDLSIWRQ